MAAPHRGLVTVAGPAVAADAPPEFPLTIDKDQPPSEVKVKADAPFVLVMTNGAAKAAEFESKDLRVEKVVPAGKTVNVRIRALKPGSYAFFDDFDKQRQPDRRRVASRRAMGGTFVVTLREGFEAALILGIVYTYLQRSALSAHYRYATRGRCSACSPASRSASSCRFLRVAARSRTRRGRARRGLRAAVVLTWHHYLMRQHASAITVTSSARIDEAQRSRRPVGDRRGRVRGVFREGAQTVLFLWGLMTQAAGAVRMGARPRRRSRPGQDRPLGSATSMADSTSACRGSSA